MTRVAAVDCGTNSIRLLVADVQGSRLTDLVRRMEVVRLGQGVDRTGRLAPEALERTFGRLREYAAQARELGAERVRMVATSATRDAANRDEFTGGVREILGVDPDVATGDEEAALTFTGATAELLDRPDVAPPYLVVDIGGGSTEFVLGDASGAAGAQRSCSVDIGCVRLTERHIRSDPPTAPELGAVIDDIEAALDVVRGTVDLRAAATLVGVAGTVTTIAAIAHELPTYDPERIHLSRVSVADVDGVTAQLAAMTAAERAALPVMHPGRVDVIVAGALVLRQVLLATGLDSVVASEHDILDGIALSLA